jgi:phosphoribosylformylglycinamidine synthase
MLIFAPFYDKSGYPGMKFGIVVFPGSNCDHDMEHVLGHVMGAEVQMLWHKDTSLQGLTTGDCIILPGGFSYGDYLRAGALARFSPIMKAVIRHAGAGGYVFGICNGFQILCEAGLLPGALLRNAGQKFISKMIHLWTVTHETAISSNIPRGKVIRMPVAHADGRYVISPEGLAGLYAHDQVIFQYCDEHGDCTPESNVNGSADHIAGICNKDRNVFGMMPHPERASEMVLGCDDGKLLFDALMKSEVTVPVAAGVA